MANPLTRRFAAFGLLAAAPLVASKAKAQTVTYSGYTPPSCGAFHVYSSQEQYVTAYSRCQPLAIDTVEFCDLGSLAHIVMFDPNNPHTTGCLVIDQPCYADLHVNFLFRTPALGQNSTQPVNVTALIVQDFLAESVGAQGGESGGTDVVDTAADGSMFNLSAETRRIYKCPAGKIFFPVPCCNYNCCLTNADSSSDIDTVQFFEGKLWQ